MTTRSLAIIALLTALASCATLRPYESEQKDAHAQFNPYTWPERKQNFLEHTSQRVRNISSALSEVNAESIPQRDLEEAKRVLSDAEQELQLLKYASVREWESEMGDFLATLNDLEEKYERVRRL